MAQSRSFKEYIANRFYNEFFTAVSDFLEQNHRDLDITSKRVYKIDRAELSDICVKHVFIENHPGMRISFDVLLEADFEIGETDRHNDRFDEKTQWFKVSCTGDLSNNLRDFAIASIEEYYNKNKQLNPMSDSLVPIIKSEQMESVAKEFLEKYYREALYTPMGIDPTVLAERMGLTIHLKNITPDFSSFGQIFFTDCDAEYYDKDESEFKRMPVNKGAIFVDPDAYFLRNLGSVNNTIVHECVHWDLHRKAFELERLYNEEATQIKCLVVGGINPTKARSATDWMEWQANALAPRILMPADQFRTMAEKYIQQQKDFQNTSKSSDVIEMVIQDLSNFFKVSKQAAKIRLIDLGYEEAIGALTYIDDRYITNYTFTPGALKRNQTYAIPLQDALTEYAVNPELRQLIDTGRFLYVDAHYCINDPQYIEKEEDGSAKLTEYALNHVDECCLAFDITFRRNASFGAVAYNDYILFKNAVSDSYPELHFQNSGPNKDISDRADQLASFSTEAGNLARIKGELPATFSKTLVSLMDTLGYTVENLAEKAQLSDRHIRNWRNTETAPKSLRAVVAVCIGMQLHPILSHDLIHKSGHSFMNTEEHIVYQMILNSCYMKSIFECSDYLTACGFRPFNSDQ